MTNDEVVDPTERFLLETYEAVQRVLRSDRDAVARFESGELEARQALRSVHDAVIRLHGDYRAARERLGR